jgi:uncharacterized membrane protein
VKGYVTVGLSMLAAAALIEAALIPGLVIGGAAMLAPTYLPKLRRRLQPASRATVPARLQQPVPDADAALPATFARLGIKQAVAKTITFRIIVTTLDFTTNYVVIGELATAAGLSGFNLVAGPLFYLAHETAWNYFRPGEGAIDLRRILPLASDTNAAQPGRAGLTVSRALAKTITFRTLATIIDFTTNYVVVREVATAAGLSAFAFVVGPFVYLGHEKVWEYYGARPRHAPDLPPQPRALPAPG